MGDGHRPRSPAFPRSRCDDDRRRALRPRIKAVNGEPLRSSARLAALDSAPDWLNSPRLTAGEPRRKSRAGRLLDLHLHQLAAHAALRPRLGAEIPAGTRRRSACTRPSSASNTTSTTSAARCGRWGSSTRSPSTTTTRSGARSTTSTGRRSTSSMRADVFASITWRGRVRSSRRSGFSDCWREAGAPASARASVSVEGRPAWKRRRIGTTCNRRRTTSATIAPKNFASPGGSPAGSTSRLCRACDAWRSISGRWPASGRWAGRRPSSAVPNGRIVYRFHARDLHLVMGPPRAGSPSAFACRSTASRRVLLTAVDVDAGGNGTVVEPRLYQLIRQPQPIVDRQFEIEFLDAGVETFSFTFG